MDQQHGLVHAAMMRRSSSYATAAVAAAAAAAAAFPLAATAQQAILDTSRPFAPGAAEGEQSLRGPTGWGTYQEGVADGLHYRFDPDGYARFGNDARLGPDSWEVVCVSWPEPDCTGRRGALVLTVAADGHSELQVAGVAAATRFRLEGGPSGDLTLAEISAPARRPELMRAARLVPAEGGPAHPLDGLATVARYVRWAESKGAAAGGGISSVADAATTASGEPARRPATPAGAGSDGRSRARLGVAESGDASRALSAALGSHASVSSALVLDPVGAVLPRSAEAPRSCPAPTSLPAAAVLGDAIDTLRGITGVYVFTEYLTEPGDLKGRLRPQIRQVAEERLRAAGFRVLSRQEMEREPGRPRLEFTLTPGNPATGCPFRVNVGLRQEIVLVSDPSVHLITSTWGDSGISDNGLAQGSELETLGFYLDRFIDDWRTANSGEPRVRRRPEEAQNLVPKKTLAEKVNSALTVSVAATVPLSSDDDEDSRESGASGRQGGEASSSPTLSTTLGLTWPDTGWFGRLTLYDYLIPSRQQRWNPDFAYSFGYDIALPNSFSLTYSNYGGNRFNPDRDEEFTRPEEGSIRLGYKVDVEDRLLAPMFTETMRILHCEPAVTANPTYSDEESGNLHNFKTSLSFGCRYPIWRDALYASFAAFLYPVPDQQQEWDPDFIYSFGWAKGRPGTFSLEYTNYSGNRWPWHDDPGNGGFLDGAITLSYRLPLGELAGWLGGSSASSP